ncbi:hypothetical protein EG68_02101 [Paragonimus skrjabini miyazakii]|uniref:Heat shock protein 70 n=1 Tax=Paragonimus skrjabini miyazakii TaxID=59628 RepID=A0A8S9Z1J5_9TREM|nr:hypothetical protein EG68_02101 [Paragonimus skrjabini miyazakii]
MPVIGIDLGTTNCCVSVMRRGKPEVIINGLGFRTTPSYVSFTNQQHLVGDAAVQQVVVNPLNTIYDAKRMIGRAMNDPSLQADMKIWSFHVVEEAGVPMVEVTDGDSERKLFRPEEISAFILSQLVRDAEDFLGTKVEKAVITVPAYFNDAQRQATREAGRIASLEVEHILNEPTAAALAYARRMRSETNQQKHILVFDLGGGTFDVTLMAVDGNTFNVIYTDGDMNLGGEDFVNNMVNHFLQEIQERTGMDYTNDKHNRHQIRLKCITMKHTLSRLAQSKVGITLKGQAYPMIMTRAKFEDLNEHLFEKTIQIVDRAMQKSGLEKGKVDEVLLVGGSTRIPKIQQLLSQYFDGKELNKQLNPDEAVAMGAAIRAEMTKVEENRYRKTDYAKDSAVEEDDNDEEIVLLERLPLSLGLRTKGGQMGVIIPRNTYVPTSATRTVGTAKDGQRTISIKVYQGEMPNVKDNLFLGEFTISGLPEHQAKRVNADVTFSVDENMVLTVTAVENTTGIKEKMTIEPKARLTDEQIEAMQKKLQEYEEHAKQIQTAEGSSS